MKIFYCDGRQFYIITFANRLNYVHSLFYLDFYLFLILNKNLDKIYFNFFIFIIYTLQLMFIYFTFLIFEKK